MAVVLGSRITPTQVNPDTSKGYDPYNELGNDPFESVARLQTRYDKAGEEPPEQKQGALSNLLMGALGVIDSAANTVRGGLQGGYEGAMEGGIGGAVTGTATGMARGLTHAFTGDDGGFGKYYDSQEWAEGLGIENKYGKFAMGLATDILTDPLTYYSFGTIPVAKTLAKGLSKTAMGKAVAKTLKNTSGDVADDILKRIKAGEGSEWVTKIGKDADKTTIDDVNKWLNKDVTKDLQEVGQEAFGKEGFGQMDIADRLLQTGTSLKEYAKKLMNYNKSARKVAEKTVNTALKGNFNDTVSLGAKKIFGNTKDMEDTELLKLLVGGDDAVIFTELSKFSDSVAHDTLVSSLEKMFLKPNIDYWKQHDPKTYSMLFNLGKLIGLDKMAVANMDVLTRKATRKSLRDSAKTLTNMLTDPKMSAKIDKANKLIVQSADDIATNSLDIVYMNGLKAVMDKETKRRFVSFMGKPLADITPYTDDVARAMLKGLQASAKGGNKLSQTVLGLGDSMTKTFTQKIPLSLRGTKYEESYLKFIQRIQDFTSQKGLIPTRTVDGIYRTMGEEAITIGESVLTHPVSGKGIKPNDLLIYHTEGMEQLRRYDDYIAGGMSPDDVYKQKDISELAIKKMNDEVKPYLNAHPHVEDYLTATKLKLDVMHSIYKSMDHALGKKYSAIRGYMHHTYWDEEASKFYEMVSQGGDSISKALSGSHTPSYQRKFMTLADAEKTGNFKPMTNIMDVMAMRQTYTARLAHRSQFLNGSSEIIDAFKKNIKSDGVGYNTSAYAKHLEGTGMDSTLAGAEAKSIRTATEKQLMDSLGSDGLLELSRLISKTPIGTTNRKILTMQLSDRQTYYIDSAIAHEMQKLDSLFFNDMNFNELKKTYDGITRGVKTMQTVVNPAFHIRNNVGELVGTALDIEPSKLASTYQQAFDIMRHSIDPVKIGSRTYEPDKAIEVLQNLRKEVQLDYNGTMTSSSAILKDLIAKDTIKLGDRNFSIRELLEKFETHGLKDSGIVADTAKESMKDIKRSRGRTGILQDARAEASTRSNKVTKALEYGRTAIMGTARRASSITDSYHRFAHFIGALERKESFKVASDTVKKFHVDYSDLTRFEKNVMRRIVPYYTFSRHNVPMQLRLMLEKPSYPAVLGHLVDNSTKAMGNPSMHDYQLNNLAIPFLEDDDGTVHSLNLSVPFADLNKLNYDFSEGESARNIYSQINPMLKLIPDLASGENIGLGIPMKNKLEYVLGNYGAMRNVYKAGSEFMGSDEDQENRPSIYDRPDQKLGGLFSKVVPVTSTNPKQVDLSNAYSYRDQLIQDMKDRKAEGEEIPLSKSEAKKMADMLGIPVRDVPSYLSREQYNSASYRKRVQRMTPDGKTDRKRR